MKNGRRDAMTQYVDSVNGRYRSDLLMNMGMVLVALLPIVTGIVLYALVQSSSYFADIKGNPTVVAVPIMAEGFIISVVIYRMYARLRDHSKRDSAWRKSLINYAGMYTHDLKELKDIDREGDEIGSFPGIHPARILMVVLYLCMVLLFFWLLPSHSEKASAFAAVSGIVLAVLMFVTVFAKVLSFPYRHEHNQITFVSCFRKVMAPYGVNVEVMEPVVEHRELWKHLVLAVVTLGLYAVVLMYSALKSMNEHMKSQWIYEDRLYVILRKDCYRKVTKEEPEDGDHVSTRSHYVRMPPVLIAAELFMAVICVTYVLRLVAAGCDIYMSPSEYDLTLLAENLRGLGLSDSIDFLMRYVMVVLQATLLATTVNAMMTIASRRPKAWRNVVINCVTFALPVWLSQAIYDPASTVHLFDLDPVLTTVVLVVLLVLLMVSRPVREFYTPATMDVPGAKEWIKYAFCGDLKVGEDFDFMDGTED